MNDREKTAIIHQYLAEIKAKFRTGQALEHAYRPAFERLMESFPDTHAINDPKRSEFGAPDFVFSKKSSPRIIQGYAETKDLDGDLDKVEKTNQMDRYRGYSNLILTNYLEFRFFRNGEKYRTISIGKLKDGKLITAEEEGENLLRELEAFLTQTPEAITSGLRLAQIMGGRARRLRDNIIEYLKNDSEKNRELLRIYDMMKELLIHDLQPNKFADMYAQTLVYGLFVARYHDPSSENFSRSKARDLVPKSNPFLLQFFDHIVGPNFDTRLAYIVDELCEIFSVSNVQEIVHKHLRVQEDSIDERDPIIHFYEDFLQAYDPNERKKMGAYYTPVPVVRYIIRQVDRILKEDFGIAKGIASDEMITQTVATQPYRRPGDRKDRTTTEISVPRVQILDPAVGTATFLNETIKFIYQGFKGQEGRWPAYVNGNLIKRLFGFELMMAPYTIAHMKLGMTLKETGVEELTDRLGVYLTNTLEEGIPLQQDLFSFGLAEAVSEESRLAAQVKSEHPVMVVMGNPPYSVSSSNKSEWINNLMADYKRGVITTTNLQPLSDDYLKFIRFAQFMIDKNGVGIVGFICNRSLLDGIVHHKARESLMNSFNKIEIVDLNGDTTRNQALGDKEDQNVFDIKQGTCILLLIKSKSAQDCSVLYKSIRGNRQNKFDVLNRDCETINQCQLNPRGVNNFFLETDLSDTEYQNFISVGDLFVIHSSAIATSNDDALISYERNDSFNYEFYYRPFDIRYLNYDIKQVKGNRYNQLVKYLIDLDRHFVFDNLILTCSKNITTPSFSSVLVSAGLTERKFSDYSRGPHLFPLYIYDTNGIRQSNLSGKVLKELTRNLKTVSSHEDIFSYLYAILFSPNYRARYTEFLKIDFPRIPIPTQDEFDRLVPLGRELRELHLMRSPVIDDYQTTFPISGDCLVEKIRYVDNKVWINKTQYFGNVPELAWNFYIGGYQPAQKWLKDRKGRQLSNPDLIHYQRTIKILLETDRIMKEIG